MTPSRCSTNVQYSIREDYCILSVMTNREFQMSIVIDNAEYIKCIKRLLMMAGYRFEAYLFTRSFIDSVSVYYAKNFTVKKRLNKLLNI